MYKAKNSLFGPIGIRRGPGNAKFKVSKFSMPSLVSRDFFERLLFVGGPPRSGTTFLAQSLNLHPRVVTLIDDHVFECWGLYYYRLRCGLVDVLRKREVLPQEAQQMLWSHLVEKDCFKGLAKPSKLMGCLPSPPWSDNGPPATMDSELQRFQVPVDRILANFLICLKSPEISHVLPQLAGLFPKARFILVYRPLSEIAESMYRKGNTVKRFPVFYRRWLQDVDENGKFIPPPGIPREWYHFWPEVSDFQRCVINAAAYLRALIFGVKRLSRQSFFLYEHTFLQYHPEKVFGQMAKFIDIEKAGFIEAVKRIQTTGSSLAPDLRNEFVEMVDLLGLELMMAELRSMALCDQRRCAI